MNQDPSTTTWIGALKQGDPDAAEALWPKCFEQLVRLARSKLGAAPRRVADEEDVAVSAFRSLCDGASRGTFAKLESREDLWQVLAMITARKAIDQKRRLGSEKRGGGMVRGESAFIRPDDKEAIGLDHFSIDEPTPEFLIEMAEERQRLLTLLDDEKLHQVAILKMEGWTNPEIAEHIGVTLRSVERKLRRIREKWTGEVAP